MIRMARVRILWVTWFIVTLGLVSTGLSSFPVLAQSSTLAELRFQGGEIQVGEAIELDLMLVRSVEGIQRFDITISIENSSIARMQGVSGGVLSGTFFQVASQTEESVRFRAVDLEGLIEPGAENLVLAEITFVGVREGTTGFDIKIDLLINDSGAQQEAAIEGGTLFVVPVPVPEVTPAVSREDITPEVAPAVPQDITPEVAPTTPQEDTAPEEHFDYSSRDLDGDGKREDIDGDGLFTAKDVALFARAVDSKQGNDGMYDFNMDGRVDFDDAIELASAMETLPTSVPVLRLEDKRIKIEPQVDLDLVLACAPGGLQSYEVAIFVEDSNIAQVVGVESAAIDRRYLEVVRQSADSIVFWVVDLKDEVRPGAESLVLATLRFSAIQLGQTAIGMVVKPMTNDLGQRVDPLVKSGSLEVAVFSIGEEESPRDLNGDGLFEDVNGDGRFTIEDVRLFGYYVLNPVFQENWRLFDFDSDGDVDFGDAVFLAGLVQE